MMAKIGTGNILTNYTSHGSGFPLVFIHGAFMDHHVWEHQIYPFARKYQVITYDLRGHGLSGNAGDPDYSVELLRDDLLIMLNNLEISCVHLCGLGLGGMIAQDFASHYPARVEKLILCDTLFSATYYWSNNITSLLSTWLLGLTMRLVGTNQDGDFVLKLLRFFHGKLRRGETFETRHYLEKCQHTFEIKRTLMIQEMEMKYCGTELSGIYAPTLIVAGLKASENHFLQVEFISNLIPNVQVRNIRDAGHISNLENPEIFNNIALDFLA